RLARRAPAGAAAYRNALALRPAHAGRWTNLAALVDSASARRARRHAAHSAPDDPVALFNHAGDQADPEPLLRRCLTLAP
ncbi:hypothetical protein, partial [Streptomyces turgidiscabies]|uniref:hypothetical protein n=1 Tax=Streptomyces turgidiscabies TaxID=85558 RepID=UPI0038F758D1